MGITFLWKRDFRYREKDYIFGRKAGRWRKKKKQYLGKVGNPYLVKVGSTMVKIRFANNGVSFEEAFEGLLLMG